MSAPIIFTNVRGVVAQSFLEQMPSDVDKIDFFKNTCKQHNIKLDKSDLYEVFSLEGQWNDFINVDGFLRKHLLNWLMSNQTSEQSMNHKPCELSDLKDKSKKMTVSCPTLNNLSETELNTEQVDIQMQDSQVISSSDVYLQEQGIELTVNGSITDSKVQNSENDVSVYKNSLDDENEIYMDIKLSHRPPNGLFQESGNTPVTVVMRTEESLMEAVCLESAITEEVGFQQILEPENVENKCNNLYEWKKIRSKKYEEKAEFKFFCTQCSFKSKRQSHLKKHSLLHERVCKLYSCDHCDFSTIRLGHLQRHVMQHSEVQLSCSACSYKTHSRLLLRKHQNAKHKTDKLLFAEKKIQFQCEECDYSTTREKLFQRHQVVHSGNKNTRKGKNCYECIKCSFKTTTKSNLARHTNNVHDAERPYLCNVCGQGFKRSDTLTQHLVVHAGSDSNIKSLQCPHCQKFYRSKSLLHEHILAHSDSRTYLCEMCGAAFKTRAVQRKHVRMVHSNSKSFTCNHCSKKFNSKFAVQRHMKLHQSKTIITAPKAPLKPTNSTPVPDEWASSVMTLPIPDDVQVLVVQQDDVQQGVIFNEGAIFVQNSAEVQMESSSHLLKPVNVPVLPVEYVLPEDMANQICSSTNLEGQFSLQDGEVITLQFVQ